MSGLNERRGRCFCGRIRFEVSAAPLAVTVCHCTSCQRATGSVMVPWATFSATAFAVVAGELTRRESSPGVTRGHCALCGAHVTYANAARPAEIDVTVASFEDAVRLVPTSHIWVEDKLPWVSMADGLPQFQRTASEGKAATVTLFRPVGPAELELIEASGWKMFPPRLPEQPIFYPVLNEDYAAEIAQRWNVRESGSGYVTAFEIDAVYVSQFRPRQVGGSTHRELWVPAEELEQFNAHIRGPIRVVRSFQ